MDAIDVVDGTEDAPVKKPSARRTEGFYHGVNAQLLLNVVR
ncbi:hypothetical protein ABIE32_002078 [Comamonas sp. 4034]